MAGAGLERPAAEASLPWVEKYRPKSLDDLVAHEDIISTINRLIDANKLPHLLLYGPPGTGKTSTILACARRMFGEKMGAMTLELNASDDRGIRVVREKIKEFAGSSMLFSKGGVKLIILDEADAMVPDAQFALRRVIEKYTKNTRFCLICNYVSKIIPALQSRCTKFRFAPLVKAQVTGRLQFVIDSEGLDVTPAAKEAILKLSGGDMRRVLNVLQAASMAFSKIDEDQVYMTTGDVHPKDAREIVQALMSKSFKDAYEVMASKRRSQGLALTDIITHLAKYVLTIKFPGPVQAKLLSSLADIEYRLSFGTSDKLQQAAVVGAFAEARAGMERAATTGR
jgi:replication factor C subunit 3/5